MSLKTLLSATILALLFTSCALQNERTLPLTKVNNQKDIKQQNTQKIVSKTGFSSPFTHKRKQRMLNLKGNGYIKGVITKIDYSKNRKSWIYHIKGIDTSNRKLDYAVAYGKNGIGKTGDLVYAIINNGVITSSYIYNGSKSYKIKKRKLIGKIKHHRKKSLKSSQTPDIRHREQIISAPVPEKIVF